MKIELKEISINLKVEETIITKEELLKNTRILKIATPGCYIFYGKNNVVLYVGHAIDVRSRVIQHLTDNGGGIYLNINKAHQKNPELIEKIGIIYNYKLEHLLIYYLNPQYNQGYVSATQ